VPVSMRDVGRLAGVSTSTVSNVVNKPESVSPEVARRVLAAIDQLGFVRNDAARRLRVGRSDTIGLVVINITNPFFADMAMGVEAAADAAGYSVLLANSAAKPGREGEALDLFARHGVDGVLVAPAGNVLERLDVLRQRGIPVVLIDRVDDRGLLSSVAADNVVGGRLATEHLIAIGRRRLLFIGGSRDVSQMRDRLSGARDAVAATRGVSLAVRSTTTLDAELGLAIGAELAAGPADARPDGVFAANDMLALGLIQGLARGGLRVPEDVAVIGYDDIAFAAAAVVPLSTIRQPSAAMGEAAARLLIQQLREPGPHPVRSVGFEPTLVVRASTGTNNV
jgi:LacI family transcriptional regulator